MFASHDTAAQLTSLPGQPVAGNCVQPRASKAAMQCPTPACTHPIKTPLARCAAQMHTLLLLICSWHLCGCSVLVRTCQSNHACCAHSAGCGEHTSTYKRAAPGYEHSPGFGRQHNPPPPSLSVRLTSSHRNSAMLSS